MRLIAALLVDLASELTFFQSRLNFKDSDSAAKDRDLMVGADRFVEERLLGPIAENFPRDRIFSEEEGESGPDGDFQWWIDPVDGTRNFIHGLPTYAVSVGLCYRDDPVAGVVQLPALGAVYRAVQGAGAFKNDAALHVSRTNSLDRALISSGLPFNRRDVLGSLTAHISAFISAGAGLRRTGSTAIDLCWIAEGRFDAMWEQGVSPWDTCAASVILREAGGRLSDFSGKPYDPHSGELIASNGVLHDSVTKTLQNARKVEGMN